MYKYHQIKLCKLLKEVINIESITSVSCDYRINWGEWNQLNQQIQTQAQNLFSWINIFPQNNSSILSILHVPILSVSSGSWELQICIHMINIENKTCLPWHYAGLKCGVLDCTAGSSSEAKTSILPTNFLIVVNNLA